MIPIPGFPDYFVDGTDIISMKFGKRRLLKHSFTKDGYPQVTFYVNGKPKNKRVNRLLAQAYLEDYSEDLMVDHIDRNPTNNNISNLRMATSSENQQNTSRGDYRYHKRDKIWEARITLNGKRKYLGRFNTEEEARAAYLAEKIKLHPYYIPEIT